MRIDAIRTADHLDRDPAEGAFAHDVGLGRINEHRHGNRAGIDGARRVDERIPAAYLTHEAWLGEFRFYVDPRVIVPRSFVAELIPDVLQPFVGDPERVTSVLDLCTGSGCLADSSRCKRSSRPSIAPL